MSDVGRYRKVYARLWRHPGFANLNEGEKVLALYLLTGPQTNRLGLYCLSVATAAEDWERFRKPSRNVSAWFAKRLAGCTTDVPACCTSPPGSAGTRPKT